MKRLSNRIQLTLLFLFISGSVLGQTDSLLEAYSSQTGIDKLLTAIEFGAKNYYSDPKKAIAVCSEVTPIAQQKDSTLLQGKCCNIIGLSYWMLGNLDSANLMFNQALKLSKSTNDIKFQSKSLSNLARLYAAKTSYDTALSYSLSALKIQQQLGDTVSISTTLASMGKIYIYLNDMESALQYQNQAKALLNQEVHVAKLGKIQNTIGYIYDELGDYDSAVTYYNQSLLNKEKANDRIGMLYTTTNMCVAYRNIGDHGAALDCNKKALGLSRQLNAPEIEAVNLLNIGINLSDLSEYKHSIDYLDSATVLLESQNDVRNLRETEGMYWYNYEKLGDYKNAFKHHKAYKALADSILNIDKVTAVEDLRTQYESDKKEAENILLQAQSDADALKIEKKNNAILGITIGSSLVIGIILLLFNRNRLKQKTRQAQKDAEAQMAITLAEIESRENERKRISRELHDGIGQQLTAINFALELEDKSANGSSKINELIQQAATDVRTISHQMMPKSLTTLGLDKAINEMVGQIPPSNKTTLTYSSFGDPTQLTEKVSINVYRIVQECINNALKHADASTIEVVFARTAKSFSVTVEDNGIGFNPDYLGGHGLTNLKYRAKIINASFSIESRTYGTTCTLTVPV